MSLISEALKKARGVQPDAYQVAHPPPRRTVAPWLAAAVAVGVAGGVVIGVFVRHQAATPSPAPAEALVVEAAPAPVSKRVTASAPEVRGSVERETTPSPVEARDPSGVAPVASAAPPAAQIPPVVAGDDVEIPAPQAPTAQPTPQATAQPVPAVPPQATGPSDGDSFHREVTLPGGDRLELGGIAWSERNPAALVNGRVLGLGEGSGDWTLIAVERDQVQIEWRGTRFFLRLK